MEKTETVEIDTDEILERMYGIVPEVIEELWHRLPFDQPIILSNGRPGHFKKFVAPKVKDENHPNYAGRWCFGVDFVFDDGGSPDHLEFYLHHTGGGGGVDFVFDDGGSPDHLEFYLHHTGGGGGV